MHGSFRLFRVYRLYYSKDKQYKVYQMLPIKSDQVDSIDSCCWCCVKTTLHYVPTLSKGAMMHDSWSPTQTHSVAWSLTRPQKSQVAIFFVSMIRSVSRTAMSVFNLFKIHSKSHKWMIKYKIRGREGISNLTTHWHLSISCKLTFLSSKAYPRESLIRDVITKWSNAWYQGVGIALDEVLRLTRGDIIN